uniref:Uncharacterized protein n=1 Tax=Oryza punctata TaxID=4537 RepID=A0A0E0JN33_ORYPU
MTHKCQLPFRCHCSPAHCLWACSSRAGAITAVLQLDGAASLNHPIAAPPLAAPPPCRPSRRLRPKTFPAPPAALAAPPLAAQPPCRAVSDFELRSPALTSCHDLPVLLVAPSYLVGPDPRVWGLDPAIEALDPPPPKPTISLHLRSC